MEHLGLLIAGAVIVGMTKGGLASAAAIVVPMLALVMNPIQAAALLLPVFIVTDWVSVWLYRHDYSGRNVVIMLPAMLFGTFLATLLIPFTSQDLLLLITGGIGLWYCWRKWFGAPSGPPRQGTVPAGLFWGTLTGITSFITHSGAPPSQSYLLPQRLPRLELAGTIAITFAVTNLAKLPGYWALGEFEVVEPGLIAILVGFGIAGTFAGRWLIVRLNDDTYIRVIEGLLFVLSVILAVKGTLGLIAA